jgi:Helix-turn-helix domain
LRKTKSNSARHRADHSASPSLKWYEISDLIAGLDAPINVKYLLELARRHTNSRRGVAWTSQKTLAFEMSVSVDTVGRAFAQAKKMGILGSRRVRTGKNPKDQYAEYWLVPDRMKELQRTPPPDDEHTAPVTGDADEPLSEHTAPMRDDGPPNTPQIEDEHTANSVGTHRTHAAEGLQVLQEPSKAGRADKNHPPLENGANPKPDDCVTASPRRNERIKTRAQTTLEKRGHDPAFVTQVLNLIQKRARKTNTTPATANYYVTAFDGESFEDWTVLLKIDLTHEVVETAAATGKSAADVLLERLSAGER